MVIVAREETAAPDRGEQSQQRPEDEQAQQRAVYLSSPDVRTFW